MLYAGWIIIGLDLSLILAGTWILILRDKVKLAQDELEVFRKVEQIKQKHFIDNQVKSIVEFDRTVKHLASLAEKKKASVNWDDELKGLKR